ncbi:hypothetical protein GGR58DRAFT_204719 [Xylaria digitata]|nr:hypothetical protein GGR58DRAFT_204719 [Xylaria digitata]
MASNSAVFFAVFLCRSSGGIGHHQAHTWRLWSLKYRRSHEGSTCSGPEALGTRKGGWCCVKRSGTVVAGFMSSE